jgi:hypothetical protein
MGEPSAKRSSAPSVREAPWRNTGVGSIPDTEGWRNARNMPATDQENVRDAVGTLGMLLAVHT